ncbi:MAG: glycosyl hydrolase, partial [Bacteroidetes bacterium]|nr:glycosyl hydrolase [Bacteroidota bacterium]
FKPYLLKSTDQGRTWESISSNLPENGSVHAFAEDYKDPNLLFVGTEFGLFFSNNGGKKWIQLKGNMPTIPVMDIAIQKQHDALVAATFGRGIYILDDYALLRTADKSTLSQPATLFPVKKALMYVQTQALGDTGKAAQGESYFTAPNPPYGATFTYYLKNSLETKQEDRQHLEAEAQKTGTSVTFPTDSELTTQAMEPNPQILVKITDEDGQVVRYVDGPVTAGIHLISWNLTYPSMVVRTKPPAPYTAIGGPFVIPGKYTATLNQIVNGKTTRLSSSQSFSVRLLGGDTLSAPERDSLAAFQRKVAKLHGEVYGTINTINKLNSRIKFIENALNQTPSNAANFWSELNRIKTGLDSVMLAVGGNATLGSHNINTPPSIYGRIEAILYNESMSTAPPPETDIQSYHVASEQFAQQMARLHQLAMVDLKGLERQMRAAGAPWIPGTFPEWKGK